MDGLKGKRILIVEDDADLLESLMMDLEDLGVLVLGAQSGHEALQILSTETVDAVVSDIKMPNGNGIELLKRLKEINPKVPVLIFMTGFSDLTLSEALDLGAETVIHKPFDLDDFHRRLERLTTAKSVRWASPPPEVYSKRLLRRLPELDSSNEELRFGRGGFCFKPDLHESFSVGEGISFDIAFDDGKIKNISGSGMIVFDEDEDLSSGGVGLEFEYVAGKKVAEMDLFLDAARIKAYIPKLDPKENSPTL
jgi:CheY-like chemotaxis protein